MPHGPEHLCAGLSILGKEVMSKTHSEEDVQATERSSLYACIGMLYKRLPDKPDPDPDPSTIQAAV